MGESFGVAQGLPVPSRVLDEAMSPYDASLALDAVVSWSDSGLSTVTRMSLYWWDSLCTFVAYQLVFVCLAVTKAHRHWLPGKGHRTGTVPFPCLGSSV